MLFLKSAPGFAVGCTLTIGLASCPAVVLYVHG
jgi:hypothetical protein